MLLAVLQGVSELFPISSLGHTVLIPALLHWQIDEGAESFLAFVVVLHLGTALALHRLLPRRMGRASCARSSPASYAAASAPAATSVWGGCWSSARFRSESSACCSSRACAALFASPMPVAIFLMVNGLVMFAGEALRRRQHAHGERASKPIERLTLARRRRRRRRAELRAAARHLAFGRVDRGRAVSRSRPRRCCQLLVLARDAGDLARPRSSRSPRCSRRASPSAPSKPLRDAWWPGSPRTLRSHS